MGGRSDDDEDKEHIFYLLDNPEEECTEDNALKEENRILGSLDDVCEVRRTATEV